MLSYCAAEHVNSSVASFQSSDFTGQMSPSTWQWPFSWWRQDWLRCLFIYFAFGVCGLQAKFLSMQAASFCSVCSIPENKPALWAHSWTFIKRQLFKHGIMNYFPNGQTQSACYRENKRLDQRKKLGYFRRAEICIAGEYVNYEHLKQWENTDISRTMAKKENKIEFFRLSQRVQILASLDTFIVPIL